LEAPEEAPGYNFMLETKALAGEREREISSPAKETSQPNIHNKIPNEGDSSYRLPVFFRTLILLFLSLSLKLIEGESAEWR